MAGSKMTTCLWFDKGEARKAAEFYFTGKPVLLRYLLDPFKLSLINFGVVALSGVAVGALLHSGFRREFRIEWFAGWGDFFNHAVGGALMGIGGVLAMGCTFGQAISGMSTLAVGSILTFLAIVMGAAGTMRYQYWRISRVA